ncbi:hypothetical protein ACWC5C_36655 [Streptomyces sp. NPDC001700]
MTEASIPPQPTRSPDGTADLHGLHGLDTLHDLDDLVIEDLTTASWEAVAPRICICTVSGE